MTRQQSMVEWRSPMKFMKIAGIILGISAILCLCVGASMVLARNYDTNTLKNDAQAIAVVTSNVCREIPDGPNAYTTYCAEYQFQTKDGKTITFNEQFVKYPVGQKVQIYYDPKDPANTAQLAEDMNNVDAFLGFVAPFLIIIALLGIIGGLILLVMGFVKGRQDPTAGTR